MQKHLVLGACGVALGLLALWWVRPDTAAGSTFLVLLALLLVQAVGAIGGMIARWWRGPPRPLAIVLLAALTVAPARAQQPVTDDAINSALNATALRPYQIEIINRSQKPVTGLVVAEPGGGNRGPNLLSQGTVAPNGERSVGLPASECRMDIRIVFADGRSQERLGVDLCEPQDITLAGADVLLRVIPALRPPRGISPSAPFAGAEAGASQDSAGAGAPAADFPPPAPPATAAQLAPPAATIPASPPLHPARVFLAAAGIPPGDVGAYGVMALRATPTPASAARLGMACAAFLASLPPQSDLPPGVTLPEQMLTVWPLKPKGRAGAERGSCPAMLAAYDLEGGLDAIRDATTPNRPLSGRGPFLIGWSPSKMRGVADAVVLVVDMSDFDSQDSFDQAFLFWQRKIVEDPALWRSGFSGERLRLAVRDFVDHYGGSIAAAIKIWGGG